MSVVGRELPAPLSALIYPHNSRANNPALRGDKDDDKTRQQREQIPQGRIRDQKGTSCPASFRLELRGDAISLPVPGCRELELGSEDVFHIGKGDE